MLLSKKNFPEFLDAICKGYNADYLGMLPKVDIFPESLFPNGHLEPGLLTAFIGQGLPAITKSVGRRILAILMIQESRDNGSPLDLDMTWNLIADSINCIPVEYTISSIGSQGFLSIPLFKSDKIMGDFDFIRLHIWDDALNQYMDVENCERFSIHTHTFYARSWTITGNVINNRYSVTPGEGEFSLFTVEYNSSLNNVNQHTSRAVNIGGR